MNILGKISLGTKSLRSVFSLSNQQYPPLKLSLEQAKETPMVDLAFFVLKAANTPFYYRDLMTEVSKYKGFSDEQTRNVIAQLYTEINVDGRFACVGNNLWGLKRWYPVDNKAEDAMGGGKHPRIINDEEDDMDEEEVYPEEEETYTTEEDFDSFDEDREEAAEEEEEEEEFFPEEVVDDTDDSEDSEETSVDGTEDDFEEDLDVSDESDEEEDEEDN
ncbi:MAG: DNA-directed RNA polymerase subunit delta [Gorillibacterium sp.]|nr:DNA-directed RNA polymerase subunit delta [Gorillibacterium sp.]